MIVIILNKLKGYQHFKVSSSKKGVWYDLVFLDGKPLCECSYKHKRRINTICKHIKFIIENRLLLTTSK